MQISQRPWTHRCAPLGVDRCAYTSDIDGVQDWALAQRPLSDDRAWIVHLHGHGSTGDQLFTRADIRDSWLQHYNSLGLGVLSPNLRGNAWMCPDAAADLHDLLGAVRREYDARAFCFVSGSMGGTSNLIYSVLHPADVMAVVALCPVTDIVSYHTWCANNPGGVRDEIRRAIEGAYGGRPDQALASYDAHTVTKHAHRLTMPVFMSHATGDETIPVEQSRELSNVLQGGSNLTYVEIDGGNHDSPILESGMLQWIDEVIGA